MCILAYTFFIRNIYNNLCNVMSDDLLIWLNKTQIWQWYVMRFDLYGVSGTPKKSWQRSVMTVDLYWMNRAPRSFDSGLWWGATYFYGVNRTPLFDSGLWWVLIYMKRVEPQADLTVVCDREWLIFMGWIETEGVFDSGLWCIDLYVVRA